jgi:hypothetical protein
MSPTLRFIMGVGLLLGGQLALVVSALFYYGVISL